MEFMNSRTIFSALSKLREIQEIISLIFHEHSHLRLKENKKLSLAKSSPFLSDYDEIIGNADGREAFLCSSGALR